MSSNMLPPLSVQFKALRSNWHATILIVIVVAVVVWYFTKLQYCPITSTFMNRSANGYYYDTTALTFVSKDDRDKGIQTLIKMFANDGVVYTQQLLSPLSDSIILMILESEDDAELTALKSRVVMLIDPNYKYAFAVVHKGAATGNILSNDSDRQIIYDILVKYFTAKNTPITVPRARWSDVLLIRTFNTLTLPSISEYV